MKLKLVLIAGILGYIAAIAMVYDHGKTVGQRIEIRKREYEKACLDEWADANKGAEERWKQKQSPFYFQMNDAAKAVLIVDSNHKWEAVAHDGTRVDVIALEERVKALEDRWKPIQGIVITNRFSYTPTNVLTNMVYP